jgi:putative addiction module killer protein
LGLVICSLYATSLIEIRETAQFSVWLRKLDDGVARGRIAVRLRRLAWGNPGDVTPVGQDVSELRIDYGPGYRAYFCQRGKEIVILLCGGDKRTQRRDIAMAHHLVQALME